MRQIHIVKYSRLDWPDQQFGENACDPIRRALPFELHSPLVIMRHRNTWPAVKHRFPDRRYSSRVMHIRTQIAAMIDAAQYPIRVGNEFQQSNTRAVRRRAMDRETMAFARLDTNDPMRRDRVADSGLRPSRGNHDRLTERASCDHQRLEARGVDAIIVANQKLHQATLAGNSKLENEIRRPALLLFDAHP